VKITRAKVGTHSAQVIYVVEGEIKLGSYIRWVERPEYIGMTASHILLGGIIDEIHEDGLVFVERM
jgi:hypothetical protein